jgi:hypothetical protein
VNAGSPGNLLRDPGQVSTDSAKASHILHHTPTRPSITAPACFWPP